MPGVEPENKVVWIYFTRVFDKLYKQDMGVGWYGLELENTNDIWWDMIPFDVEKGDRIKITVERLPRNAQPKQSSVE